ncbi:MAG: hypothetical protein M3N29_09895 [Chloroflexota bacterium]|nr:hypothetical protein [Chloroflexota bacterium]
MSAAGVGAAGLPSPFFRHLAVLLLGAGVMLALVAPGSPIGSDQAMWLVLGGAAGVIAGLIGRGWLGLLFLLSGIAAGLLLALAWQFGSTEGAAHDLGSHGPAYASVAAVALAGYVLAYLLVLIVGPRLRRPPLS